MLRVTLLASIMPAALSLAQSSARTAAVELDEKAFLRQHQDHEKRHRIMRRDEPSSDPLANPQPTTAAPTAAPPNPPANPFGPDCPNEQVCEGKGDQITDDAACWDCFESYRIVYCEKLALSTPPSWKEKCALEQNVRDVYCSKFAEEDPPAMQETCFFKDSNYKSLFCEKAQKKGKFEKRCAEDDELGEGFCEEFGKKLEGFLTCKGFHSYLSVFCDKKSNESNYDPVCATNPTLGATYCMGFAMEATIRTDCVSHQNYIMDFCDKQATLSNEEATCATDNRTRVTYCNELAMKKEQIEACWNVDEFPQVYCHEVNYQDPKCLEIRSKAPEGGGELSQSNSSENFGDTVEKAQTGKPADSTEDVNVPQDLLIEKAKTRDMDKRLPSGWRSGYDAREERYYFFPVEEMDGTWRRIDGTSPTWNTPTVPWVPSADWLKTPDMEQRKQETIRPALLPSSHMPFADDPRFSQEKTENILVRDPHGHHLHHRHRHNSHSSQQDVEDEKQSMYSERVESPQSSEHRKHKLQPWRDTNPSKDSGKQFGIRAGVKLWHQKQEDHKKLHPFKPSGSPHALWAAVEEGAHSDKRPPVMTRDGDGQYNFHGGIASPSE